MQPHEQTPRRGAPGEDASIVIRPAALTDLPAVRDLLGVSGLPLDGIEEQFGPPYAVALVGGIVVGVAGMERYGDAALLRSAAVAELWRGHGLGERLTREQLAWARAQGVREVWLLTTTAAAFFPRFGFAPAERSDAPALVRQSREFREACPASAVAMRLLLPPVA